MKHLTLLISMAIACFLAKAQGPQQLVTVPVAPGGGTAQGWLYLPADYNTNLSAKYPVVIFFHGVGEAGTNPYTLLNQGLPQLIASGMRPDNITNPVDGQSYSFIVLSLQHWSWSPSPAWIPYELTWLQQYYRIDTTRVYVTGLSAGGQSDFNSVVFNDDVSSKITAGVPMSPAAMGAFDSTMISKYKIRTWFLSGSADPFTNNAMSYMNMSNRQLSNSSRVTVYTGGHCCWNTYYNKTWHDPVTGMSIWEWLLTNKKTPTQTLPVQFTDFTATDMGNNNLKIEFTYSGADGTESFYIQLNIGRQYKKILVRPEDKIAPNKYSKVINLSSL